MFAAVDAGPVGTHGPVAGDGDDWREGAWIPMVPRSCDSGTPSPPAPAWPSPNPCPSWLPGAGTAATSAAPSPEVSCGCASSCGPAASCTLEPALALAGADASDAAPMSSRGCTRASPGLDTEAPLGPPSGANGPAWEPLSASAVAVGRPLALMDRDKVLAGGARRPCAGAGAALAAAAPPPLLLLLLLLPLTAAAGRVVPSALAPVSTSGCCVLFWDVVVVSVPTEPRRERGALPPPPPPPPSAPLPRPAGGGMPPGIGLRASLGVRCCWPAAAAVIICLHSRSTSSPAVVSMRICPALAPAMSRAARLTSAPK